MKACKLINHDSCSNINVIIFFDIWILGKKNNILLSGSHECVCIHIVTYCYFDYEITKIKNIYLLRILLLYSSLIPISQTSITLQMICLMDYNKAKNDSTNIKTTAISIILV